MKYKTKICYVENLHTVGCTLIFKDTLYIIVNAKLAKKQRLKVVKKLKEQFRKQNKKPATTPLVTGTK